MDPEAVRIQKELLKLAESTNRGFSASSTERKRARELIFDLARFNPTAEPAAPYYETSSATTSGPTLAGTWTLVYTDAPDITSLENSGPLAKLGRIGQECDPPLIKNVIEWQRPDWSKSLPFSGSDDSRVFQKVCTEATASPDNPFMVNLKLVGIEVVGRGGNTTSLEETIQQGPAAWFQANPVELRGPLTAPFGQFEVLYLDDRLRIIKTGQNYVAVNMRNEVDWF